MSQTHFLRLNEKSRLAFALSLRFRYKAAGFIDESIQEIAERMNCAIDDLLPYIQKPHELLDTQCSPVTYYIPYYNSNNEGEPTYFLSEIPTEECPKKPRGYDGLTNHPYSNRHRLMFERCYISSNSAFHNYGARGVRVCDAWHRLNLEGRVNYIEWLTNAVIEANITDEKFDVDRIDNDGNYCPDNCRVVSRAVNSQNTRCTVLDFDKVVKLRRFIRAVPEDRRRKQLVKLANADGVEKTTYIRAVSGSTWQNVNEIEPPVYIKGGKSGYERRITDELVVSLRKELAALPRKSRRKVIEAKARELGVNRATLSVYMTGGQGRHLDHIASPVLVDLSLTNNDVKKLCEQYLEVAGTITLNEFCIEKGEEMGVSRGTIYDRLSQLIPESVWKTRERRT